MLKMKKLFTLIVFSCLFVLVVAGCGSKKDEAKETNTKQGGAVEQIKRGKLVVGVKNDTNLFGLKNPSTGQVEGFDVDVAKALAKKILGDEKKLELKEVTSKTRIPLLKNGDIDAIIATMTITEERKKRWIFQMYILKQGNRYS